MGKETGLDKLARELAAGEISRRAALKRLAAAGLGIGAAAAPTGVAHALGGGCPGDRVKCDGRCCPNNARCRRGKCKCRRGFTKCGRNCVDLQTSNRHCGECGKRCPEGKTCVEGDCVCVPDCAGKNCGGDGCGGNCGTCTPPETCGGGGISGVCGCTDSRSAEEICFEEGQWECGWATDNCGQTISCGYCAGQCCDGVCYPIGSTCP